ncbi:CHASE3 domain-containing protein [Petrocella sp. FN5]|uniref:CHASE3 domain-containing protein n=1 Tax=Petrocella sp. FN5 TaxID=3032002 RepID=UPI0023DCAEF8|nr:MCP four helix bundle domain-containing protein [Petrocella sp. FN5]MDF1617460.1 MCP four helix bundle domain-containing protein [Petrocella sp. FN5]
MIKIKDLRKLNLSKRNFKIKDFRIKNLKIGYKIAGSLGIIFLLFGLLSIFILFSIRNIEASSTEVKDTYMVLVKESNDLNAQMQELATHIQLYLVTGNEDEYNEIMKNQDTLEKIMEKVESHVQSNPIQV